MGATIVGDTIFIDSALDRQLTKGERRVVLAHELGHYRAKDRLLLLPVVILFFWCPVIVNAFKRWLERRADRYALDTTKDYASFISLMDKLQHNNSTHPSKYDRILMAVTMRGHQ